MILNVQFDISEGLNLTKAVQSKLPHIIADSLNRTGDEANAGIRNQMMASFTIRDKRLPKYVAPIKIPRESQAKPGRLYVVLHTEGKGRILDPFETGKPKVMGANPVAVPTFHLRPNKAGIVGRSLYPSNLGLTPKVSPSGQHYYALGRGAIKQGKTPFSKTKGGVTQIKGKQRTFVLDPKLHKNVSKNEWGVYMRTGPGRDDIKLIWSYRTQVKRPANLKFKETAHRIALQRWPSNMREALHKTIREIEAAVVKRAARTTPYVSASEFRR